MSEKKTTKKGLSKALKWFYGVGDCGFTLMSNIESYYFNFFLTNLAQFSLPMVTLITTVSSTVDAVLSWIYGAILNSIKPMKWGRYRSWLVVIPWLVPFLYAFQFIKIGDGWLSAIIIIIAAIASHVAWNFAYVANVSMISVAGKTPEERSQLSSTRAAWANFSKVIFSYVGPGLAAVLAGVIGEVNQYGAAAFVLGCIMAVLYYAHFRMFDGYEEVQTSQAAQSKAQKKEAKDKTSGMDLIRALLQNPPLIALLIADLAKFMFNFVLMGVATYYFTYVAGNDGMLSTYILVTNIFCVIGAYLSKSLSNRFTTRSTTIGVMAIQAVLLIVSYVFYNNVTLVIILMSVAMFGYGITYACTPALYGDTIVYSEWKTGKNAAGWISGLQNVPLKVSIMTRGIIISACLAMGGWGSGVENAAAATDELKNAISIGFMVIPAIALIVAVVALVFGFRLTKDKVNQYAAEIASRS